MKVYIVSLINAIVLITLSLWGYFSSATPSITALIPAIIGVLLLLCYKGVKNENKIIAHIAVLLTLVVSAGLIKPLIGASERNDTMAILRVLIMLLSAVVALYAFVRSFIDARKNKQHKDVN
ncbi:MAG: hypothetical protein AAGF77_08870 [Bacteroidota bacterium]